MKTVRSAVVAAMIGSAAGPGPAIRGCSSTDGAATDGDRAFGVAAKHSATAYLSVRATGAQERQVVDHLTAVLRDFDSRAGALVASLGPADPEPHLELDATSRTYSSGHTRTVVVKVYRNLCDGRPATTYRAFPYDLAAQAPITWATLFPSGTRALEVIAPAVARQIGTQARLPLVLDPADCADFALTDDAVVFFFGSGQLHPAVDATEVAVARTVLAEVLNPRL
ncbi:hypothetical protein ACN27E_15900 [Mycobacterium sp. WMMD1722]|uniref:hypothetical protein n=1 Tax=Mycobacterium sp. WMMD1722 TaxID=3404117 RepID=UPI003BF5106C